ncbi:MAG: hypothetical protein OXE96_02915 [Gemmatimonadetes bacterium]|nr:hypothetical protein [Gemmatimonadota bacterium]
MSQVRVLPRELFSGVVLLASRDGASPGSDKGTPVKLGASAIEVPGSSDLDSGGLAGGPAR